MVFTLQWTTTHSQALRTLNTKKPVLIPFLLNLTSKLSDVIKFMNGTLIHYLYLELGGLFTKGKDSISSTFIKERCVFTHLL